MRDHAVGHLPAVQALRRVSRTVSSTALKNAQRHRPELDLQPELDARCRAAAGSTRRPTVARNGFGRLPIISNAAPVPTGRSMQIVVVSRKRDLDAEVVGQRRLDDLLLHLAVERDGELLAQVVLAQVDQRVLLGQLGQGGVQRAPVGRPAGDDDRLQRRRRELAPVTGGRRRADRVADPDLGQPPELADLPGRDRRPPRRPRRASNTLDRGDLASRAVPPARRSRSRTRTVPANIRT